MIKGDRLKNLRLLKGLTQTGLGNLIGVDKSTICCYEKNTRNPSLENILDFMKIFGVSADYLFGTDYLMVNENESEYKAVSFTEEEKVFLEELRKNPNIYKTLLDDPKKGIEIIKIKIG